MSGIPVKAVLFDVDGVVVNSELLHLETFNDILAQLGIKISERDWKNRFLGMGSREIMTTLFSENGVSENPQEWISRRRQHYRKRIDEGALDPVPGFLAFYSSVKQVGLKITFVSSGEPGNVAAALRSLGIEGETPVIDSSHVSALKPDPEAYLLAAQQLQVPVARCLVFEDSPTGIKAAKAAHMQVIAVATTSSHKALQEASLIIADFSDWTITKLLRRIRRRASP
ncbi:MAG: HAD family hydrolase [Promethearchaeota archaeon]